MTTRWTLLLAGIAIFCTASPSNGQTSSYYGGTQTSGMFGANTLGGTSSTTSGQSASTGSGGNSGSATSAATPNVAMGAQNVAASASQNTRQQTAGAFVGADTADTGNFLSRQNTAGGAAGRGGNNGLAQLQNLFSQSQQNFNGQNQSATLPQIRISLKLGFKPQPVSMTRVRAFETRLTKLPGMRFVGPAEVLMEGRTAVLRGKVATEEDRELAAALAKMEPDVLEVRNELVVVDSPETAAELLPPSPGASP